MRISNNPPAPKSQKTEGKIEKLESLIQKNTKTAEETLKIVKKIDRYIFLRKVWGMIRFTLVLISFILAFIYLPGYLKKAYEMYQQIVSPFVTSTGGTMQNFGRLIEQLQGLSEGINLDKLKK